MTVSRVYFRERFSVMPSWHCPRCASGTLRELIKDRQILEPTYSKATWNEDWWDPTNVTHRFCSRMQCVNPTCGEFVLVIGFGELFSYNSDQGEEWSDLFYPRATHPPVPVFRLNDEWPAEIRNELVLAFGSVWADAGGSANRLRTAIECLLDYLKVKRFSSPSKTASGRRTRLSLHDRILAYRGKNAITADLLLAIKWLGNAGSHANIQGVTRDDVLDGMEIMEHVMHQIFDRSAEAIAKLAKSINKKRGPVNRAKTVRKPKAIP